MTDNNQFTAAQFIEAISGSGGILSIIAAKLDCDRHTVKEFIEEHPIVTQAYIDEYERALDKAESVVLTHIGGDEEASDRAAAKVASAKWYIGLKSRMRPRRRAAFGGGKNIPGSTQPGDVRPPEECLAISEAMRGNLSHWKHGLESSRLPSLFCDTCQVRDVCEHYREGSVCTVPDEFRTLVEELGDGSPEAVENVLIAKIEADLERYERAIAIEARADGGRLNREVTSLSNRLEKSLKLLAALRGRYDIVGGRRVMNFTQQNLIIGGELSQTALILLKLPPERRGELLSSWQDNLATQRQILEEAGIDVAGVSGLGGVASAGHVLAELEERISSPPGVQGRPPGKVEGRGIRTIDGEARVVD